MAGDRAPPWKACRRGGWPTNNAEDRGNFGEVCILIECAPNQMFSRCSQEAWVDDLRALGAAGDYFFSSNEYIMMGLKA